MTSERARDLLAQARQEAEGELQRIRGAVGAPVDDQADASSEADDITGRETDEALEELLTERLAAIVRAEQRLSEGTYGQSVKSRAPIPDARLEVEPWAELTVEEQAAA